MILWLLQYSIYTIIRTPPSQARGFRGPGRILESLTSATVHKFAVSAANFPAENDKAKQQRLYLQKTEFSLH